MRQWKPTRRTRAGAPPVAGVGNIFKSEACFAAHLDPWQEVGDLPEEQLRHVAQAAHDLMQAAVDEGRGDRAVYKRAGRPCPPSCQRPSG